MLLENESTRTPTIIAKSLNKRPPVTEFDFAEMASRKLKEQMPAKIKTSGAAKTSEILKSLKRADKLIDCMAKDFIDRTVDMTTKEDLKSTYVIKGNGNGRGNGMSHPLMDYKCLSTKAALSIKKKLGHDRVGGSKGATI